MNNRLALIVALALTLAACERAENQAAAQSGVDDLIALLEGSYRGPDATVANPGPGDMMTDTRIHVRAPQLGEHVVYWEVRSGPEQKPGRQILTVLTPDGDGFIQSAWRLRDGWAYPDEIEADTFAAVTIGDVMPILPEGCDSRWSKTEDGWAAYLDPANCRVYSERRDMWRRIEAETIVSKQGLRQTERGFSDDGEQLFGTPPGEYHLLERL